MKTVGIFLVIVGLGAVVAYGQEQNHKIRHPWQNGTNWQILRFLEDNSRNNQIVNEKLLGIDKTQNGIESSLKKMNVELSVLGELKDSLKKLERNSVKNFESTTDGLKNLTNSIKSTENRTNSAILSLGKGQQEIKQVLIAVDANQNKYERNLNAAVQSVHDHITDLDAVIKQSVLKELVQLGQTAKKLESSQKLIENKIGYLDELTALSGITANKLQHLEEGVKSLNVSQQLQLKAISGTVQQVGTLTWQIDNKLGVLLSTQKNIERDIKECKRQHGQHNSKDHHEYPGYGDHGYEHGSKDSSKASSSSDYDSDYSNVDEASYLYQLWYGKDTK